MTIYDENILHKKLKSIIDNENELNNPIPAWIRRFYRKLSLRQTKRMLSKPLFNLHSIRKKEICNLENDSNILDRYYHVRLFLL